MTKLRRASVMLGTLALAVTTVTPATAAPLNMTAQQPNDHIYSVKYPAGTPAGQLIATEKATGIEYPSFWWANTTYKIAFTTRDSLNHPRVGTALLTQPWRADGTKYNLNGNKIWVNNMYINGLSLRCSPTQNYRTFTKGVLNPTLPQMFEGVLAAQGASNLGPKARSFSVLTPDLLGTNMAYGANIASGRLILDAMRAVSSASSLGYTDPDFMMQGFSGGAMASAAATALLPRYAPSLTKKVKAVFMGGTPVDMISISAKYRKDAAKNYTAKGNPQLAMGLGITMGLARQYPELANFLNQHVTSRGRKIVRDFSNMCLTEMVSYVEDNNIAMNDVVDINLLNNPILDKYLRLESVNRLPYMPSTYAGLHHYFYHGTGDVDVSAQDVKNLYSRWKRAGVNVTYTDVPSLNHISAQPVAIGPILSLGALELYRDRGVVARPTPL